MTEQERFDFVEQRDGSVEAMLWAVRTYRIYRTCVYGKKPEFAQTRAWKPIFVKSLLELRRIIS